MKVCARSLIETLSPSQEAYEIFVQKCYWEHAGSLLILQSVALPTRLHRADRFGHIAFNSLKTLITS